MQEDGFVDKNNECVDNRRSSSDNGYIGDNNRALCLRRHVDDRELLLSVLEKNCNHPTSLYAVVETRMESVWSCC